MSLQNPEEFKIVILDNGAFHHAKSLQILQFYKIVYK